VRRQHGSPCAHGGRRGSRMALRGSTGIGFPRSPTSSPVMKAQIWRVQLEVASPIPVSLGSFLGGAWAAAKPPLSSCSQPMGSCVPGVQLE
jgi:hypothetical protein